MQNEIVQLLNGALSGEWHHAKHGKRLVIICHGFRSSSENPTLIAIAAGLNQAGIDTFRLDFSENTGGFDIAHQVQDIEAILIHFQNYEEFVLVGHSLAALTSAIASLSLPIDRLVTLNGFFGEGDLGDSHRKAYVKFRLAASLLPKYKNIHKYYKKTLQPSRIKIPVLVIHSQADQSVAISQSENFYQQLTTDKHFVRLASANHGLTSSRDRQQVVAEIVNWLK